MTYTLTLCIGMFLGLCGTIHRYDYPTLDECEKARLQQVDRMGKGYAICAPKERR